MKTQGTALQLCTTYVVTVGLEAEGWSTNESSEGVYTEADGFWTNDAGLNQCEAVTNPQPSKEVAMEVLRTMSAERSVRFEPFRPSDLKYNSGQWQPGLAYEARVGALKNESPEGYDWLMFQMPNCASLQVSMGGNFDPFGNEGAFLVNIFNDIAPWHASMIHKVIGYGYRHLGLWQFFAYPERFPKAERWFSSGRAMVEYIESIPRLVGEGFVKNPPDEFQNAQNPLDLKNIWWYARPKRDQKLGSYLEVRYLPSMLLDRAEVYVYQLVNMTELLLSWFFGENAALPVRTREDALPAYALLRDHYGNFVPKEPLDSSIWKHLMQEG